LATKFGLSQIIGKVSNMPVINGLNTEKLLNIVESIKQNWETGKTVWTASARWVGGFRVETESRGFKLQADEPDMLAGTNTVQDLPGGSLAFPTGEDQDGVRSAAGAVGRIGATAGAAHQGHRAQAEGGCIYERRHNLY